MASTSHQCTVEITNNCSQHTLCNPRMYLDSGACAIPLSLAVGCSTTKTAVFTKTLFVPRGSVGVFTYDLCNNHTKKWTEKIAVMFSVPLFSSNWYTVGILGVETQCDSDLYYRMYNNSDTWFTRGEAKGPYISYKSRHFTIQATMSDTCQSVMKVEVTEIQLVKG